jgi:tRNA dimethylallyltransferase
MSDHPRLNLLVIVGPTGVGKTQLALDLAPQVKGEIISADSRYLYEGLDIGTAKPTVAERALVLHHLIDVTRPDQPWSLAQVQAASVRLIAEINGRGHLPMLVGGTGQYIDAILEGWSIPAGETDAALRAQLEQRAEQGEGAALYEQLQAIDPEGAAAIDGRNLRRVIRALEVTLRTGRPFSEQRQKNPPDYNVFKLGLRIPRELLYQRLDARVDKMIGEGLVAEVQGLADMGYAWTLPALSAIGYKQIGMYLRGELGLPEAFQLIKHDTHSFVRRQGNWFKETDPNIHWFEAQNLDMASLVETLRQFFGNGSD